MADDEQELSEHTVLINGVEHTLMLTDEDAEKYEKPGDSGDSGAKAKTPANKARGSDTK